MNKHLKPLFGGVVAVSVVLANSGISIAADANLARSAELFQGGDNSCIESGEAALKIRTQ